MLFLSYPHRMNLVKTQIPSDEGWRNMLVFF